MSRKEESGNILFYILIAVVLFAALSFAVAQMMRGGNPEKNEEVLRLQASEILQYVRGLTTGIQTIKIEGLDDGDISFDNPFVPGYTHACPDGGDECALFKKDGGKMIYMKPVAEWLDANQTSQPGYGTWIFSGANAVIGIGTDGGGAASSELLAILPWVNKELCVEINNLLKVVNPVTRPPQDSGNVDFSTKFTGTFSATQSIGGDDPEIEGQRAGCFEGDTSPPSETYHFFQVLISR